MLSAKEARNLAGVPDEEYVNECIAKLLTTIERLAKNGKRKCIAGYSDHKGDEDLWVNGGYSRTKNWELAQTKLKELGYKVTFFYEERQFVDAYTLIEW